MAATRITARSSTAGEVTPAAVSSVHAARPAKAPAATTSPWANWMMSSTPKKSVNPTATRAYIMPSIAPFITYCASRLADTSAGYLLPTASLRLPLAYSLSSQVSHLPSWTTYW